MKRFICIITVFSFSILRSTSQTPEFYKDIRPLLERNCLGCHKENGIAPLKLESYKDVVKSKNLIKKVITSGYMPPWKPDPAYSHFLGERILSDTEKQEIIVWINSGCAEGNLHPRVVTNRLTYAMKVDKIFKLPFNVEVKASKTDTNVLLEVPYELERDTFISAFEFVTNTKSSIHHAMIYIQDLENVVNSTNYEDFIEGDYFDGVALHERKFSSKYLAFTGGWIPGQITTPMPDGIGFYLPQKGVIVYQIHYGPTPVSFSSNFELHLNYAQKPVTRIAIGKKFGSEGGIVEPYPPLLVPPDSVMAFSLIASFPDDYSIISMSPHMHLLGKSFKAWIIKPSGDTLRLISIPNWDFNWQGYYYPENLLKIEKGSVLHAEVVLDNSQANRRNPNNPPKFVKYGDKTSDEMIQFSVYLVPYNPGDEKLSLKK